MSSHHQSWAEQARDILDNTNTPPALVAAGLVPLSLNISDVYFLLLIPPAAYHCWKFFRDVAVPAIKKFLGYST